MIKRIYVTPKDIREGGVKDGWGKDAITRAMRRALKPWTVTAGGSIFAATSPEGRFYVGKLPAKLVKGDLKYEGPRFNFRVEIPD